MTHLKLIFHNSCPFQYWHLQNRVRLGWKRLICFTLPHNSAQALTGSRTLTNGLGAIRRYYRTVVSRLMWAKGLICFLCLICSNSCTLVPGMDWFSSPCTDVTFMGKHVQIAVLPETPTVLGMEMLAQDMHPLPKGQGAPPSHMGFSHEGLACSLS